MLTVRNDALVTFFERTFDTGDPERWTDRHFEFMVDNEARPSLRARTSDSGLISAVAQARPRSHVMSTCGIPQSMYSPLTTA